MFCAIPRRILICVCWAMMAVPVFALGKSSGSSNPNYEDQERRAKERDAYQWRSNVKDYPPPKAYEPSCNDSDKRDDCLLLWRSTRAAEAQAKAAVDQVYWSHAAFWFLVFTFGATFAAAAFARQAVKATRAAAITADMTHKTMQDTAERQLRAYVDVFNVVVVDLLGTNPRFYVNLKNSGQTPAMDLKCATTVRLLEFPHQGSFDPIMIDRKPSSGSIGAQGTNTTALPFPQALDGPQMAALRNGTAAMYVFGTATYRDIFGKLRRTDFRVFCGGDSGILDGVLANCEDGNDAK